MINPSHLGYYLGHMGHMWDAQDMYINVILKIYMHRNISCFAHAYFSSAHLCSYGILGYVIMVLLKHNQNWKNRWNNDRMSRTRLCTDRFNGVPLNRWNNMFMYSLVKSPNDKIPNISAMSDQPTSLNEDHYSLKILEITIPQSLSAQFQSVNTTKTPQKNLYRNYLQPYNLFAESLLPTVKGPLIFSWSPGITPFGSLERQPAKPPTHHLRGGPKKPVVFLGRNHISSPRNSKKHAVMRKKKTTQITNHHSMGIHG